MGVYEVARILGTSGFSSSKVTTDVVRININPKYLSHMYVQAQRLRLVMLTGIRLGHR